MPTDSAGSNARIETDALIIGAGPVGLFQVFELGLLGIRAHVVDTLPYAGGQCVELYADKPIYDIPGLVRCTGRELTDRLLAQIKPFQPDFHFGHLVSEISTAADGRFEVTTDHGQQFVTKAVVIAAGVGAFVPRKIKLEGSEATLAETVHYHAKTTQDYAGKHVLIVGDSENALCTAIALSERSEGPASIGVVHRRDVFSADASTQATFRNAVSQGRIGLHIGQPTSLQSTAQGNKQLHFQAHLGSAQTLQCDALLVMQGLSPKLGPVAEWGLAMERKQLSVSSATFETSTPGIFAVGDINHYEGKRKLIVCGFHEATLAAFAVSARVQPSESQVLQYTTSSALLQQRLGVL